MTEQLIISSGVRRVIVVVLDGLRPDAITRFGLQNILRLARNGASTFDARTVSPSVTAAAMGSLLTGAAPSHHGLESERFHIPRAKGALHPVAHELARCGMPSSGFMAHVPWLIRPLARRIARTLGLTTVRFRGNNATQVLEAARTQLRIQDTGLILLHWADADRAGHEHGWMSDAYGQAAVAMDRALGQLMRVVDLSDRSTVMIALADHGGGGRALRHHNSDHPADRTIPVIFAGGGVRPGTLPAGISLLDVPATILALLGIPRPASYAGQSLVPRGMMASPPAVPLAAASAA
ncbi:hypothetical protein LBMAG44_19420 [Gemmatimonadota bacterium]|nr:hypothetical protein LBMAG44_19420 [Gemmatimonadota bacterium]